MAVEQTAWFVVRTQRQLRTEDNSQTGVMPATKRRLCDNSSCLYAPASARLTRTFYWTAAAPAPPSGISSETKRY